MSNTSSARRRGQGQYAPRGTLRSHIHNRLAGERSPGFRSLSSTWTNVFGMDGGSAMDMMEQRIREVLATLLSKGAQVLERTAGELAQAATDLRQDRERVDAERVWVEKSQREPRTAIRGAPLRAVPDTPTDEGPSTEDRIAQIAGGTVSQVRAQLADLSTDELRELRDVEAATRNRTTLLSAIDRALAEND